ncbi:MAG: chemotaxis protein CheW [Gammaproteobacteria bacterium]|nr:chemotaxis protein CheW [Gammaproteobacteria bacterium]
MAEAAQLADVSQWVTFKLGAETYGVNVMQVQEVLRVSEIAPVPGAPDYVLGIINLRGNVVSVLDIRLRFGLQQKTADDTTRIIIIELESQTIGILVDSVAEVEDVQSGEVDTAPAVGNEESSRYIAGIVSRPNGLLILVDVQRLLSEQQWQDVESI